MLLGIEKVAKSILFDPAVLLDERHRQNALNALVAAQLGLPYNPFPMPEQLQTPGRRPAAERSTKVLSVSK